jgi:hypothetical protein
MKKLILPLMLLTVLKLLFSSFRPTDHTSETPIDQSWWNGLPEEWKTIFLVNQNFSKQGVNIFTLQNEYMNRLHATGEPGYSEMNRSLYDLQKDKSFGLGYIDLYARALRKNHVVKNDSIDLATLARLETLYMVNGPGDLTPLKKFPRLKVLILNYCGINNEHPLSKQTLDLEPLRHLKALEVLHCSSTHLQSLAPLKNLINLQELVCDNSDVISLDPLKGLVNLKKLSIGSKVKNASAISRLKNLEELYIRGCKQLPDLSRLKKLKKLCIAENEMAIVQAGYRITDLGFLQYLPGLEYLDLDGTSYRGDLHDLSGLQNLKAVSLPPVSSRAIPSFRDTHKNCVIINSFQFE